MNIEVNRLLIIGIAIFVIPCAVISQEKALASQIDTSNTAIHYLLLEKDYSSKILETAFNFKGMKPMAVFPKYAVTGVFCRMEHRIEATSNFAPRFRLGSVNYKDWMEGKKPFHLRYAK